MRHCGGRPPGDRSSAARGFPATTPRTPVLPAGARGAGLAAGGGVAAPRVVATQRYAGNSLRAGLVTSAALAGASEAEIAATTRHMSGDMVARYTRIADSVRRGVSSKVGLCQCQDATGGCVWSVPQTTFEAET